MVIALLLNLHSHKTLHILALNKIIRLAIELMQDIGKGTLFLSK